LISFDEQQGVRHGGIVSPELYKVFIIPLLEFYKTNNLGFKIGSIHIGNPTSADDKCHTTSKALEASTKHV
jgi:hypothetical protein